MRASPSNFAAVAIIVLIGLALWAWHVFVPGPMAFAGGSTVALSDYHGPDPTGVPVILKDTDIVKRGEYLAHAADCLVCHIAPHGEPYAGGLAFPLPFGTLYSTTKRPALVITAMRIFSTPCSVASVAMARDSIRPCPSHLTPILPTPTYWRSRPICSVFRPFMPTTARTH